MQHTIALSGILPLNGGFTMLEAQPPEYTQCNQEPAAVNI